MNDPVFELAVWAARQTVWLFAVMAFWNGFLTMAVLWLMLTRSPEKRV